MEADSPRLLLLETSGTVGRVGVAQGAALLAEVALDERRRHARDLAPATERLLREQGWQPGDVEGVVVSQGPGSYTGLRVGLMSAKTFAWAVGCSLIAVPTLEVVAFQARGHARQVETIADAQQDRVYRQRFRLSDAGETPQAVTDLAVFDAPAWQAEWSSAFPLIGPGLLHWHERLPSQVRLLPAELWLPGLPALLALGLHRWLHGQFSDPFTLEPLYLRPSSAEEKWEALQRRAQEQGRANS
jgi:tRNA threonylcarbamoyladenosine biosynthesis protein TsaB